MTKELCFLVCLSLFLSCLYFGEGCTYGSLRLRGGSTSNQGRIEICINNVWGTVCDDGFTNTNARVVCRQLGYSTTGATYYSNAYYGEGSGSILLDNVQCNGYESSLLSCTHNSIGSNDCSHREDVGVSCPGGYSGYTCTNGSVRLVGGTYSYSGRLEICINNVWGTVCDDDWTNNNARVACRQLGYSTTGATYHGNAYYGEGSGSILLDNVQCNGYESSLLSCTHNSIGSNDCSHGEDVGVSCPGGYSGYTCIDGSLRLVGGANSYSGRLEICINNAWGTVCDDFFTNNNARVACRQLGYSTTGVTYHGNAYYGEGSGSILLDNVQCNGYESSLLSCTHNSNSNCDHSEDVGVSCPGGYSSYTCNNGSVRLVGGTHSHEGRVEICINGIWGTVCDDYFGNRDAKVVCRQLGYPENGATAYSNAHYGSGRGPILLDNVQCLGYESRLVDCHHNRIGNNDCSHGEDVGVTCLALQPGIVAAIVLCFTILLFMCVTITIIVLVIVCYKRRKRAHLYSALRSPRTVTVTGTEEDISAPPQTAQPPPPPPPPSYSDTMDAKLYELQQLQSNSGMTSPHPSWTGNVPPSSSGQPFVSSGPNTVGLPAYTPLESNTEPNRVGVPMQTSQPHPSAGQIN